MTTVADVMTRGVRTMSPSDTVAKAAQAMDELNVGVIPVCDGDKLVGMVTDRDIVVRGVAQECDIKTTKLADVMSTNVRCATEDQDVDEVLGEMADTQIRRLPVVDSAAAAGGHRDAGGYRGQGPGRRGRSGDVAGRYLHRRPSQTDPASRRPAARPAAAPLPARRHALANEKAQGHHGPLGHDQGRVGRGGCPLTCCVKPTGRPILHADVSDITARNRGSSYTGNHERSRHAFSSRHPTQTAAAQRRGCRTDSSPGDRWLETRTRASAGAFG